MEHKPALHGLLHLHAELGGRIKDNKREAAKLRADMKHVEAVIRMLDSDFEVSRITARRRYNPNPLFKRGHVFRAVLELLRTASEPMTVEEIMAVLFRSKGIDEPTRDQRRHMYGAVNASLSNNAGKTVAADDSRPRRWRVIGSATT